MAELRARGLAAIVIGTCATLTACYSPSRTAAPDRALMVYRASRSARAEAPPDVVPPQTLTLEGAVAMAKSRSARVAAGQARIAVAEARTEEAGQIENPQVRVSNIRLDQYVNDKPRLDVGLRISPARPGEIDANVAFARAEESEVRAEVLVEQQEDEAEVRWLFEEVLLFDAELTALDAAVEARRRLGSVVKARLDRQLATRIDDAYAELSSMEAEQDRAEARALRGAAYEALMDRLGLPRTAEVKLVGEPPSADRLPELPGEEAVVEAALRARPEIAAAAARIDAASAETYLQKAKRWPWFSFVQFGYEFEPDIEDPLGFSFQAGIEVPLFSLNSGGVRRAEAEGAEARRTFEAEVERIAREVRDRLREARAARELVLTFRNGAIPAADRAASEVKAALDVGQVDLLQMELVEERRIELRMQELKRLRDYYEARAELRQAAGGKLPAAANPRSVK